MLYSRLQNRNLVLQGINDFYAEESELEENPEIDFGNEEDSSFWVDTPYRPRVGEYFYNPVETYSYKGSDGFYYDSEDYDEINPMSAAIASYADGLARDDWGTVISEIGSWYGLRYCKSYAEAERVQHQYEFAIGRTSDYRGNVSGHIISRHGIVWEPIKHNFLIGQERYGVFCVSHFAPSSLRKGIEMLKSVLHHSMPVCIATLPYQANQLRKLGFHEVGHVPQWFAGEIHMKTVLVNDSVDIYAVQVLLDSISEYIN